MPKLRIEKLAQEFAAQVGLMDLSAVFNQFYEASLHAPSAKDHWIDEEEAGSEARESEEEEEMNQEQQGNIFDAIEYPLLHLLGFLNKKWWIGWYKSWWSFW